MAGAADDPGVVIAAAVTASTPPPALPPSFRWPLAAGGRLSSPFGPRWGRLHAGIDIAVPAGTDILAAAPGVVEAAGWLTGYGRVVIIQHQGGWKTLYAHAQALHVKPGQQVAAGHAIAQVGSSGRATGSHLHFEIHAQGQPLDPLPLLPL